MKKKVLFISVLLLAFTGVSWYSVMSFDPNRTREQNNIIKKADAFMDDELYIRAIPLYEEAYNMDVDENETYIENQLLTAYKSNDDTKSYYNLLEDKISDGRASESEYIEVFNYYVLDGKLSTAMDILKSGMKQFPDSTVLFEYYEGSRYVLDVGRNAIAEELGAISSNSDYISYLSEDGLYGYIDKDGKITIEPTFDVATDFYGNYAVVQSDGKTFVINSSGKKYSILKEECSGIQSITKNSIRVKMDGYWRITDLDFSAYNTPDFEEMLAFSQDLCAVMVDGKWGFYSTSLEYAISPTYEDVIKNDSDECFIQDRAFVKLNGSYILIDSEGNQIGSETFQDAKPFSSDGSLACVKNNDKWGFIDLDGNLQIDYQYEDAYSFSSEVAPVSDGIGWGYISQYNKPITEFEYLQATQFVDGISKVLCDDGWHLAEITVY